MYQDIYHRQVWRIVELILISRLYWHWPTVEKGNCYLPLAKISMGQSQYSKRFILKDEVGRERISWQVYDDLTIETIFAKNILVKKGSFIIKLINWLLMRKGLQQSNQFWVKLKNMYRIIKIETISIWFDSNK